MFKNLIKGLVEPFLEPETTTTTVSSEHLKEAARQRRIEVVDTITPDEEFVVVDSAEEPDEEVTPTDEVAPKTSKVVAFPSQSAVQQADENEEATPSAEPVVDAEAEASPVDDAENVAEATPSAETVAESAPQPAPKKASRSVTYRLAKQFMDHPELLNATIEHYLQTEKSERNATKLVYLIKTNVAFARWLRDKAPVELIDKLPIEIWELIDDQLQ